MSYTYAYPLTPGPRPPGGFIPNPKPQILATDQCIHIL